MFSAENGVPQLHYSGLKNVSARLASSARLAAVCVALGAAFAYPAHAEKSTGAPEAAAAETSIRVIDVDISANGFSTSEIEVKSGETVKFVVKNSSDVARDFTIGTEFIMERRRAYLARVLTSGGTDIDPLQRNKLDRKNAVILLPGETRELTWTFAKTDGLAFASNIAGHYENGFKGGFRSSETAEAKPEPEAVKPAEAEVAEAPATEQAAEVETAAAPPETDTDRETEAGADQPEVRVQEGLPSTSTEAATAEKPAQPSEEASSAAKVVTTEEAKPAEARKDTTSATAAADTEPEQTEQPAAEEAPAATAAKTEAEQTAESAPVPGAQSAEGGQASGRSDETSSVTAPKEAEQPAEETASVQTQETPAQTAATAPEVATGPASEDELAEAAGEAPSVPIPAEKPKSAQSSEDKTADTVSEQFPSVGQHIRVSKLRSGALKAKRARDKKRKARPGVKTNFNGARAAPIVIDQSSARLPDRDSRGSVSAWASSRADGNDRIRRRSNDSSVQRRVRRDRSRFENEGYTLRGREDSIVDDFFDENPNKVARHDLSSGQFHAFTSRAAAQGYHPVYVDGYLTADGVRFAGIWERRSKGRWIARHGLTSGEYQAMYDRYTGEGYKLIHVSGYWDGSEERFAAIWNR